MINTIADLLLQIKEREIELIKKYEIIDHPVLIGDMYEGLTKEILSKAIFTALNIKVVSGKIKNSKGALSSEIDCMIVTGEGDKIPYTEKFIYDYKNVIAVIEVKKNLFGNSLNDSYQNLKSVKEIGEDDESEELLNNLQRILYDAWLLIFRKELPKRKDLDTLSEEEQYTYHTFFMEHIFPIRIVFGYNGYSDEFALREGFKKLLNNSKGKKGFGYASLPNLIICKNNSLIKINGMPYAAPVDKNTGFWPIIFSSKTNPLYNLLELLWTRISYKFNTGSHIFGFDNDLEIGKALLLCRMVITPEIKGWEYMTLDFSREELEKIGEQKIPWEPHYLSKKEFDTIAFLANHSEISITDKSLNEETIDSLVIKNLVFIENGKMRFLTKACKFAILPDGTYCAGENIDNQFDKWLDNYLRQASR